MQDPNAGRPVRRAKLEAQARIAQQDRPITGKRANAAAGQRVQPAERCCAEGGNVLEAKQTKLPFKKVLCDSHKKNNANVKIVEPTAHLPVKQVVSPVPERNIKPENEFHDDNGAYPDPIPVRVRFPSHKVLFCQAPVVGTISHAASQRCQTALADGVLRCSSSLFITYMFTPLCKDWECCSQRDAPTVDLTPIISLECSLKHCCQLCSLMLLLPCDQP